MKTPTLSDLLQLAGEHAHRILIDMKQPDLVPSYLLLNDALESQILACPWRDDTEKAALIGEVRRVARKMKATSMSFLSETWMTDSRQDADALMVRPAEHPNRREFVFAVAKDKKETKTARWQIVRDRPGGNIIALVHDKECEQGVFSGRIVDGILP